MIRIILLLAITTICIRIEGMAKEISEITMPKKDTIMLHYFSETPVTFYYVTGLKGIPVTLFKDGLIKIPSEGPIYFMETSALQIPFILYPGDSLVIKQNNNQLIFRSTDSIRNNELDFLKEVSKLYGSLRPLGTTTYLKGTMNLRERDSIIDKHYAARISFLNTYNQDHKLRPMFIEAAKNIFFYGHINEKMSLFYPGFNKKKIYNYYKDSLNIFLKYFDCDSCINNTVYKTALIHFIRIQGNESDLSSPMLFLEGLNPEELGTIENTAKQLSKRSKDYLMATIGLGVIFNAQKTKTHIRLDSIISKIESKEYKESITETYQLLNKIIETGPVESQKLYSSNNETLTFQSLLNQKKGKLLFIDLWATWCVPCMREIPFSKQLTKNYKDKLEVIFISLDSDSSVWKRYVENNLLSETNFILPNDFKSTFAKHFKLTSIPRYILIDKNGKLITTDAPRPSDPKIKELMRKYL